MPLLVPLMFASFLVCEAFFGTHGHSFLCSLFTSSVFASSQEGALHMTAPSLLLVSRLVIPRKEAPPLSNITSFSECNSVGSVRSRAYIRVDWPPWFPCQEWQGPVMDGCTQAPWSPMKSGQKRQGRNKLSPRSDVAKG